MRCAEEKSKEEWLALFADDAVVEDPVGPSLMDPEGKGHRGKAALSAFWDNNIAKSQTKFNIERSYAVSTEVANVGHIDLTFVDGSTAVCEGVFVYKIDDEGKLVSLRAFWELGKMMATRKQSEKP